MTSIALQPLSLGKVCLANRLIAAPMAGVTDRPFRTLCRNQGAGLAVSEMLTADKRLWETRKSRLRMDHRGEPGPIAVQIAGSEPAMLAEAARINVDHGAELIDINMGCPAKKVCRRAAGSALLTDESLVGRILDAVVAAVEVPVTLKIRTGPDPDNRNGLRIARIAEAAGIRMLTVHGRTRADAYRGNAEYATIAEIKANLSIPVIANGDIDSGPKAGAVLQNTGADGLMIARAAQGNPWIFKQIAYYLETAREWPAPDGREVAEVLVDHLQRLHRFYGETQGVRVARKHIGWYLKDQPGGEALRRRLMTVATAADQIGLIQAHFAVRTPVAA
ncbi:MAG: tRNA dihydrouridine synthase DusB [Xanthomonadales bacterium]|nr:tRNA dihydrouridine synthase DusB [Xanthomonadales bacterium]